MCTSSGYGWYKTLLAEIPGLDPSVNRAISINTCETLCDLPYLGLLTLFSQVSWLLGRNGGGKWWLLDKRGVPAIILDYYSNFKQRRYYSLCSQCASTSLYDDHLSGLIRGICRALNSNPPQKSTPRMLFLSDLRLSSIVVCEQASLKAEHQ